MPGPFVLQKKTTDSHEESVLSQVFRILSIPTRASASKCLPDRGRVSKSFATTIT